MAMPVPGRSRIRVCAGCGVSFDPTGGSWRCPPCRAVYDLAWRAKRKAEGKPISGPPMPLEYRRAYAAIYGQRPEVREMQRERSRAARNNPDKRHKLDARLQVRKAVEAGTLVRQPCSVCGDPKSQGHHTDYSRPLDVVWLCALHHAAEHPRKKRAEP